MARLALRQFLRSSFDPGDKTMASPIIACLGAATLLILASFSFASITATDLDDYSDDDRGGDTNYSRKPVGAPEPVQSLSDTQGFVRRSNYTLESVPHQSPARQIGIGSRSLRADGRLKGSKELPKNTTKDYLSIIGNQGFLILEIIAKQIDKGMMKIAAHTDKHRNGEINVPAETEMGRTMGKKAEKYFSQFFKDQWVGILAHMVQETFDRFYAGSEIFFAKSKAGKYF